MAFFQLFARIGSVFNTPTKNYWRQPAITSFLVITHFSDGTMFALLST